MYNTPPPRDAYGAQIGHYQQHGQTSVDIQSGFSHNQGLEPPNYIQSCMYPNDNNNTAMNPLDMEHQMIQLQSISDGEMDDLNAQLAGVNDTGIPMYPSVVENGNILNNNIQHAYPSVGHHTNLPTEAAQLAVGRGTAVKSELRQKVAQRKRKSGDDNIIPKIEIKKECDTEDQSIIEDRLNTEERLRPKFKDPSKLDPGDRELLLHRRERNKKAALKCREKKRKQVDYLQKEQQKLESENTTLQFDIKKYQAELQKLHQQWAEHQLICPLFPEKQKKQKT